ncbi:MAG: DUF1697 domain-containing protein [Devosia sp.]
MATITSYLVLLRGINVGGKNKIPMAQLKARLEDMGFQHVQTYIQSGNVILQSPLGADTVARKIATKLGTKFKLDSVSIKVLALSRDRLRAVIDNKPKGFGDEPEKYHSDAIFLIGLSLDEALTAFSPMEGVDTIWPGDGVIYSQRVSAKRTKTRLNRMMASPLYLSMTIRSWGTTLKLMDLLEQDDAS